MEDTTKRPNEGHRNVLVQYLFLVLVKHMLINDKSSKCVILRRLLCMSWTGLEFQEGLYLFWHLLTLCFAIEVMIVYIDT